MNLQAIITKSALALTLVAANLVIFSTADAEARGGRGGGGGAEKNRVERAVRDHRTPPVVRDHRTPVVRTPIVRDHRRPVVRTPIVRDHRTPVVRTPIVRDHRTPTIRPRPSAHSGCRSYRGCAPTTANASGGVVVTDSRYPRRW